MKCAEFSSGHLHQLDYMKNNVSRYFFEALMVFVPVRMPYGYTYKTMPLAHPTCYYLGTYPNYWSPGNKRITHAGDLWTPSDFPMGNEPSLFNPFEEKISAERELEKISKAPLIEEPVSDDEKKEWSSLEEDFGKKTLMNYLYPERMEQKEKEAFMTGIPHSLYSEIDDAVNKMVFFRKKSEITQWLTQKNALDRRKLWFEKCIREKYPKPKKPQYKTPTPQGPADFPGIPISEMQLPTPGAPGPPPKNMIKLLLAFGIINVSTFNGYSLIVNIEKVIL